MSIIHQHPEWKIVEDWFAKRANGNYGHVETIAVEPFFDPEMEALAIELGRAAGESIRDLVGSVVQQDRTAAF